MVSPRLEATFCSSSLTLKSCWLPLHRYTRYSSIDTRSSIFVHRYSLLMPWSEAVLATHVTGCRGGIFCLRKKHTCFCCGVEFTLQQCYWTTCFACNRLGEAIVQIKNIYVQNTFKTIDPPGQNCRCNNLQDPPQI